MDVCLLSGESDGTLPPPLLALPAGAAEDLRPSNRASSKLQLIGKIGINLRHGRRVRDRKLNASL